MWSYLQLDIYFQEHVSVQGITHLCTDMLTPFLLYTPSSVYTDPYYWSYSYMHIYLPTPIYIYIYIYIHLTICLGVHSVNTEEIHLGSYMDINIYLQLWSTLYTYVHTYACGIMVIVAGNGHKFKYWRSLFTFYIALIPLGNIWI